MRIEVAAVSGSWIEATAVPTALWSDLRRNYFQLTIRCPLIFLSQETLRAKLGAHQKVRALLRWIWIANGQLKTVTTEL